MAFYAVSRECQDRVNDSRIVIQSVTVKTISMTSLFRSKPITGVLDVILTIYCYRYQFCLNCFLIR